MRDQRDQGEKADADGKVVSPGPSRRKRYTTPRLERLGTLTELTAAIGSSSHKTDHGGPGGPRKTA